MFIFCFSFYGYNVYCFIMFYFIKYFLLDPRGVTKPVPVPTPITDEDALRIEKMLEEEPGPSEPAKVNDTHQGEKPQQILFSNLDDPEWAEKFIQQNPITENDQAWLEDLLQPTKPDQSTATMKTPEDQPTASIKDPWANSQMLTASTRIPLVAVPDKPETPPGPSSNKNTEIDNTLKLNIRMPALGEPNPYDPALPEYLLEESYIGRIPPWEIQHSMRVTMGTIVHEGERYIVLDELDDLNEWQDLNVPLVEARNTE